MTHHIKKYLSDTKIEFELLKAKTFCFKMTQKFYRDTWLQKLLHVVKFWRKKNLIVCL